MREEMLKIGIDYDDLLSRLANHEQLVLKLLKKFLNDEPINTIKQAYLNQDYDLLLKSVHTLKGVSGNLAMKSLFCITKNWVDDLRKENHATTDEFYQQCLKEYDFIYNGLKTIFDEESQ